MTKQEFFKIEISDCDDDGKNWRDMKDPSYAKGEWENKFNYHRARELMNTCQRQNYAGYLYRMTPIDNQ